MKKSEQVREIIKITTGPIIVPKSLQGMSDKVLRDFWDEVFYSVFPVEVTDECITTRIPENRKELLQAIHDELRRRTKVTRAYMKANPERVAEIRQKYAKTLARL